METKISIEGRSLTIVGLAQDDGSVVIDFSVSETLERFLASGRQGPDPWREMVGFSRPITAMKTIWAAVSDMVGDNPVWVEGCDEKRARVYLALLNRAGVPAEGRTDHYGDESIYVSSPGTLCR